jgi:hypothetical protein
MGYLFLEYKFPWVYARFYQSCKHFFQNNSWFNFQANINLPTGVILRIFNQLGGGGGGGFYFPISSRGGWLYFPISSITMFNF